MALEKENDTLYDAYGFTYPPTSLVRPRANLQATVERLHLDVRLLKIDNARLTATSRRAQQKRCSYAYDRQFFDERLFEEFSRARFFDLPLCLAVVDVAYQPAPSSGPSVKTNSKVLRWACEELEKRTREFDIVCQIDDHELAVLLPGASTTDAHDLIESLSTRSVSRGDPSSETTLPMTFGAASAPECAETASELMIAAQAALCVQKASKRSIRSTIAA